MFWSWRRNKLKLFCWTFIIAKFWIINFGWEKKCFSICEPQWDGKIIRQAKHEVTALAAAARQKPVGGGGQLTEWLKLSGARQCATTGDGYTKADRNTERKKCFWMNFHKCWLQHCSNCCLTLWRWNRDVWNMSRHTRVEVWLWLLIKISPMDFYEAFEGFKLI